MKSKLHGEALVYFEKEPIPCRNSADETCKAGFAGKVQGFSASCARNSLQAARPHLGAEGGQNPAQRCADCNKKNQATGELQENIIDGALTVHSARPLCFRTLESHSACNPQTDAAEGLRSQVAQSRVRLLSFHSFVIPCWSMATAKAWRMDVNCLSL